MPMMTKTSRSAFSSLERFDLIPEGVEPEPHLPGVAAGLVHHPPLGAEQVLGFGAFFEVCPAGEEEQRLGVVGLIEAVVGGHQGAVEPAALGQPEQRAHHRRDRAVAAGGQDRDAAQEAGFGQGFFIGAGPGFLQTWGAPPGRRRGRALSAGRRGSLSTVRSRSPSPCRSGCGPRPLPAGEIGPIFCETPEVLL